MDRNHRTRDWIAVIFALVLPTVVTLAYFVLAADFSPVVQQVTYGIAKTFQFLFPIGFVVFVQRRRLRFWPDTTSGVGAGLIFGLIVAGAMYALYHFGLKSTEFFAAAAGEMRDKIDGLDLESAPVFIAVAVFYSLIHSFLEEYYWRWFVFGQLRDLTRLWPAIAVSSLGFMAHHVLVIGTYFGFFSPATWLFSFCVASGGAVWACLYDRSGSLLGPWLSHLLVDATIFLIGYQIAGSLLQS